jgi:hypothetical protein
VSRITSTSRHGRAPAPITSLPLADAAADFEERIRRLWARGRGDTLALAVEVREVRQKLRQRHGGWLELFRSGRMPFSKRQGDRLVGIARLAWLNGTGLSRLPRSWGSLSHLAKLPRTILEDLIAQGTVHPNLKEREARALVDGFPGQRSENRTQNPALRRRVQRFCRFVLDACEDWSPSQRQWTRDELLQLIHRLESNDRFPPPQSQTEGDPS